MAMDCCFLCSKRFAPGHDIYMYRGDTPFCSVACREEQIEFDAAEERLRTKQRRKIKTLMMNMMVSEVTKEEEEQESSSRNSIFSFDEKMQVSANAAAAAAS